MTYEGVRPFCCIASKRPTATAVVAKGQVQFRCNTAERVCGECTSVSVPGGHSARRPGHVSSTAVPQSLSKHFCLQLGAQQSLVACVTFQCNLAFSPSARSALTTLFGTTQKNTNFELQGGRLALSPLRFWLTVSHCLGNFLCIKCSFSGIVVCTWEPKIENVHICFELFLIQNASHHKNVKKNSSFFFFAHVTPTHNTDSRHMTQILRVGKYFRNQDGDVCTRALFLGFFVD